MKKATIFKAVKFSLAIILSVGVIFTALILEPSIKINGFQELDKNKLTQQGFNVKVFDNYGEEIDSSYIVRNNIQVTPNDINKHTKNAFISIEDNRFYEHIGLDYFRILSATKNNLKNGDYTEGASTITQQLVKNTHLSSEKKMKRKIMEARIAIDLERRYSKDEILTMYLNAIYFGNNIYGIARASLTYFNKNVSELSLNESAFLAAIINNPSKYNPLTNLNNANSRRRLVLNQMKKYKLISNKEYLENIDDDIIINNIQIDQYASSITTQACEILNISNAELFRQEYKIETYLDKNLQEKINSIISNYSFSEKENSVIHAVIIDKNGQTFANSSNVSANLYHNKRQPASLIKPIICYSPAFESQLYTPLTYILDEPTDFNGYKPSNYKNKNLGATSLKNALKYSQNIPAVKLLNDCGIDYCKEIAQKFGCKFDENDNNLAIALGGMSKGLTLTSLINAYQVFANQGEFIPLSHIKKITNRYGLTVYENKKIKSRAISEETAYFINSILSECAVDGTAKRIGKGYAAKTGTVGNENGNSDAYVVAYDSQYIVAVWIGAKKGLLSNEVNGASHPSIIANKILSLLPSPKSFFKPETIIEVDLDKQEYLKNYRIITADESAYKKDVITAEFSKNNLPKKRMGDYIDYLNDTKNVDLKGFKILRD